MRRSDLFGLHQRAAKKLQPLESCRSFDQVKGKDLNPSASTGEESLMKPAVFPKSRKNIVICKMLPDKTFNEKVVKLILTRPELMLQVHAKHMQEPWGGGKAWNFRGR